MTVSVGTGPAGNFEDIEVGIERLHLEQDAGKSLHDQHPTMSYVDLKPLRRGADGDLCRSPTCARPTKRGPM